MTQVTILRAGTVGTTFTYFEGSTRMYSEKDLEELDAENIEFPDGSMHTLYEAEQY